MRGDLSPEIRANATSTRVADISKTIVSHFALATAEGCDINTGMRISFTSSPSPAKAVGATPMRVQSIRRQ
jgi:hypothetical protein